MRHLLKLAVVPAVLLGALAFNPAPAAAGGVSFGFAYNNVQPYPVYAPAYVPAPYYAPAPVYRPYYGPSYSVGFYGGGYRPGYGGGYRPGYGGGHHHHHHHCR